MTYPLHPALFSDSAELEPTRAGFGRGLKAAGEANEQIVALCADLTDSTQMSLFKEAFPNRFIEIGVAVIKSTSQSFPALSDNLFL